jgi:transposase
MSTTAQIEPARIVVGVDTHLDFHTVVALDQLGRLLASLTIGSDPFGYRQLVDWAEALGEVGGFAVEGTGSYGAGLARYLSADGHVVVEVDRPSRKGRRLKGKSDSLDAEHAARQLLARTATVTPKSRDAQAEMLRNLKIARSSAVKASTQAMNALQGLVVAAPDDLRQRLRGLSTTKLVAVCSRFRPASCDGLTAATRLALRSLARRIINLQQEVAELDAQLKRVTAQAAPELLGVFGVGTEIASTLLVAAGDNLERIKSEPAFASLCGVAPIPASSGKTNRHRLSRGGNRQANAALHRIVIVRLRYHEPTKLYLERRTAEGKTKKEVIRCLKRYVAREVYGALKAMEGRRDQLLTTV